MKEIKKDKKYLQSNRITKRKLVFRDEESQTEKTIEFNTFNNVYGYNIFSEVMFRIKSTVSEAIDKAKNSLIPIENWEKELDFENFKIKIPFKELSHTQQIPYARIRQASRTVKYLEFNVTDKGINREGKKYTRELNYSFFNVSGTEIEDENKEKGHFIAKINPDIVPILMDMSGGYSTINKQYVLELNTIYAKRLYELVEQYKNTGWYEDSIENFLELIWIKNKEYYLDNSFNLKRKILDPSIKKINEITHYMISYDLLNKHKSEGRGVDTIRLTIKDLEKENSPKNISPIKHSNNTNKFLDIIQKYVLCNEIKKAGGINKRITSAIFLMYEEKFKNQQDNLNTFINRVEKLEKEVQENKKNTSEIYAIARHILSEDYYIDIKNYLERAGVDS